MILLSNDAWYGLTGADNTLNGLTLQNATTQISITGWVWSGYTSSPGYLQGSNFLGNIYIQSYTINGISYTVSQPISTLTTTIYSQSSVTFTITSGEPPNGLVVTQQVGTTTYTGFNGLLGQVIAVNGLLAWGPPYCVTPANGVISTGLLSITYSGLALIGFVSVAVLAYLFMKSGRLH